MSGPTVNSVSGSNGATAIRLPCQKRPVGRTQIADHQQPLFLEQFAVLAADHGMGDRQTGLPAAADDVGSFRSTIGLLALPPTTMSLASMD